MITAAAIIGWLVLGYATAFTMFRFFKLNPNDEEDRFHTVVSIFVWPVVVVIMIGILVSERLKNKKLSLFHMAFFIKESK